MTDQTFPPSTLSPAERPAHRVTFEDYMRLYAENFAEWVEGEVIPLSPVTYEHNQLDGFFYHMLRIFLSRSRMGRVLRSPFVMRLSPDAPAREPDLQVILNENLPIIQPTLTVGAADVVIEIVSKESQHRDLVEKYDEYEAGGVREYWLINPLRKQVDFYERTPNGIFQRIELENGLLCSRVLLPFRFRPEILWNNSAQLDDDDYVRALVDAMFKE